MRRIISISLHALCLIALTAVAAENTEDLAVPVVVALPAIAPLPMIAVLPVIAAFPTTTSVKGRTGPAEFLAAPFSTGQEVLPDTLSQLRGGSTVVSNDQTLSGTVAENVASNVVTGGNSISAGSFANVNGIPIVIQNSGANVLIQNSTIINLQMK